MERTVYRNMGKGRGCRNVIMPTPEKVKGENKVFRAQREWKSRGSGCLVGTVALMGCSYCQKRGLEVERKCWGSSLLLTSNLLQMPLCVLCSSGNQLKKSPKGTIFIVTLFTTWTEKWEGLCLGLLFSSQTTMSAKMVPLMLWPLDHFQKWLLVQTSRWILFSDLQTCIWQKQDITCFILHL